MYVNLYGNIIDYDKLTAYRTLWADYDIPVIEDAAQSFGAYYRGHPSGKLGDISILSFDPTKNLNNYGSGGMVLTNDPDINDAVCDYYNNGKFNQHSVPGTNSKMSEADCAQMLVKLKYFDSWQKRRTKIAEYYTEQLSDLPGIVVIPVESQVEHSWHKYAIHVRSRLQFQHRLDQLGIETRVHYNRPLHLEPVSFIYAIDHNMGILNGAEDFCKTTVSLPIYPELMDAEVEHVVDSIIKSIS
jgi:dTDP-4-amino-4,6-dideoxygalactose transaminase